MNQLSDVQFWDDRLRNEIEAIQQLVDSVANTPALQKKTTLNLATMRIRAAQGSSSSYKAEIKLITDPVVRKGYQNRYQELSNKLSSCAKELEIQEENIQRNELFLGAENTGSYKRGYDEEAHEVAPEQAGGMMLSDMDHIQDKTATSLANTKRMIETSKNVAGVTLAELRQQGDQIHDIENDVMRFEDNLNRSDKLLKSFGKRMATDRFIQFFALVNILLLVGVLIFIFAKDWFLSSTKEHGSPESPIGN